MANLDEIYVSWERSNYKLGKSCVLSSQADLLKMIKKLEIIRRLREEEFLYKKKLHELFEQVLKHLDKLEDSMPTSRLPKSVKEELGQEEDNNFKDIKIKTPTTDSGIDKELREIREKLAALGAL